MKKIIALTIFNFFSQRLIRLWRTFFICQICLAITCFPQQPGWEIISSGTTQELNSIFFYDYEIGFACGDSGIVLKSLDSGKTWQSLQMPSSIDLNDLFMFDRDTILATGDNGIILRSTDSGSNWTTVSSGVADNLLSVSFAANFGIIGALFQTILYSVDDGSAWNISQSGFFGGGFYCAYMLSPQFGFVAGENSIFQPLFGKSTDSGVSWDFTAFYLNTNEGKATGVDFTDLNTGYISASVWDGTGAIAKSTNGGSDWLSTMFTNPLWSIDFPISGASQVGYAVGSQGTILKTFNAGGSWQEQISGTTLKLNKVHFKDFDFGFAVGENGLILRTITGGEPVSFAENENHVPYSFELFQNYPNPFNPSTKIKFTVPQSPLLGGDGRGGLVTLKVYDILGNEVATLVDEYKPAGEYKVIFDVSSGIGNLVSGIYFYQLKAGSIIQTKKMVYLK